MSADRMPAWRRSTWLAPIALGVLSTIGLLSALVGDGVWDAVSWLGLGLPIAACLWYGWRRERAPDEA